MRTGKSLAPCFVALLAIVFGLAGFASTAYGMPPFTPKIEDSVGWHLSEDCRVYKLGMLTDPDCDILEGKGIAIQITRIRVLDLPPGQDNRTTIGVQFQPAHDDWNFSAPFVALQIAGRSYVPTDIDLALVFAKHDHPIAPEKLQPSQSRYRLPPGEKRFFRLRFPVPQTELGNGFALRVTGLQKEGDAVQIPIMKFK